MGDQDWFTLLSWWMPDTFYKLPCAFNYVIESVRKLFQAYTLQRLQRLSSVTICVSFHFHQCHYLNFATSFLFFFISALGGYIISLSPISLFKFCNFFSLFFIIYPKEQQLFFGKPSLRRYKSFLPLYNHFGAEVGLFAIS